VRTLGAVVALLAVTAPAAASPGKAMFSVNLGSTDGTPASNVCAAGISCTYVPSVGALAPSLVVPFSGTVTSFSVNSGSAGGTVALHVLRGDSATFLGVKTSPRIPLKLGINTFKVLVPVEKGDVLALDNNSSALLFADEAGDPLDITALFQPALVDGETDQPDGVVTDRRLLMSATVESTPPVITAFAQTASSWREPGTRTKRRVPLGTTFSFRLKEPGAGSLVFTRAGRGVGRIPVDGRAGRNAIRFRGELTSGRMLKPGRYSVRVSISNDAGDSVSSRRLSFRIVG
jgi:hypothetical protein